MLLFDIEHEHDVQSPGKVRFQFHLVFQDIAVPMKAWGQKTNWHIGTTGADISFNALDGLVEEYTQEKTLSVEKRMSETRARASSVALKPSLKAKKEKEEVEASVGEWKFESGATRGFENSYTTAERERGVAYMRDVVRWELRLPKGPQITFDYLIGNEVLHGTANWFERRIAGNVTVKPLEICFFTHDGPTTKLQSLVMMFVMARRGIKIEGETGWGARFKEVE